MIKAIALDIYGTVLVSDDENRFPPRAGLEKFFDHCDSLNIKVFSTSDAEIQTVKLNLESCFNFSRENLFDHKLSVERFFRFYQLNQKPAKDYSIILREWNYLPSELLVIGDRDSDILGAKKYNCPYIRVPEYLIDGEREFDFSKIRLEKL